MSAVFRNSLFGFNKEDVLGYIEKNTARHAEEITALKKQLTQTEHALLDAQEQLQSYKAKEQELEQLSVTIGKLYLIAKSNSDKMIMDAQANLELSKAESEKNIQSIEAVQAQLQELYTQLYTSSAVFGEEISGLAASLADTKTVIANNNAEIAQSDAVLREMATETSGAKK